jgi:hypothetical protein
VGAAEAVAPDKDVSVAPIHNLRSHWSFLVLGALALLGLAWAFGLF